MSFGFQIKRCCTSHLCNDIIQPPYDRPVPPSPRIPPPTSQPPAGNLSVRCICTSCDFFLCTSTIGCATAYEMTEDWRPWEPRIKANNYCLQSRDDCERSSVVCCYTNFCNNVVIPKSPPAVEMRPMTATMESTTPLDATTDGEQCVLEIGSGFICDPFERIPSFFSCIGHGAVH